MEGAISSKGVMSASLQKLARKILILDDQAAVADMLSEMVKLIGHETTTENDPQKALRLVEDEAYDVILSDYRMPEMNGREFYSAAVAMRPELAQRIVFLTGDLHCEETRQFLTATGAQSISKPFHLSRVRETISDVLGCAV